MGYAESGTRLAVHNSGDASDIVEKAPVPRCGRGGTAVPSVTGSSLQGEPGYGVAIGLSTAVMPSWSP